MKITIRLVVLALVMTLGSSISSRAEEIGVSAPGSCVAMLVVGFQQCTTPMTSKPTFRYAIINSASVQWSVWACGSGPEQCDVAGDFDSDPRVGTLKATHCPCYAQIYLQYPGKIVPNPSFTSVPVGVVTSLVS